ncbi:hypothetical protein P171DRAFT_238774 [Karstenula rhodostoma CBS 690.94]|uniref:Ubiquitin 3 binding protein But2 C-terminal domain-containing protein n=1 Tax=Karstenula rhodostoma CBS 690.94 TaxID=1392251 RepID=A0A9P4PPT7_9PLEO|nr:hypothetical protein P171DRAFT_238774 [Karstenula rhodostoma CBS 690.94]
MQYFTTATTLLSAALLAGAAPTAPLETRSCSVAYPQSIGFPINYHISQSANGAKKVLNALTFSNIPAGAFGCQLEVNFPAAYAIQSSGNSQINVWTANGQRKLFGTVTLASSPVAPTKFVINSATCQNVMSYSLEIASEDQAGSVAFADTQDAGFTMAYNC